MTDIFTPIEHSRSADEAVQQIEGLIIEGVLRAGDRLPGERELSRQLDVSRPVLREALKNLEERGLIVTRHGGGTHVADVIGQVFSRPVMELITEHPKASADYLEYRREIEGVAAEYAARRATEEDRALLAGIVARMKTAHERGDFAEEAEIDVEFHNAVGECAHNIILLHTLRACYRLLADGVFLNRLMIFNLPDARERLLEQHLGIYHAIETGDAAAARKAAMNHISYVERAMTDAARAGDWQRVSKLRFRQRAEAQNRGRPSDGQR